MPALPTLTADAAQKKSSLFPKLDDMILTVQRARDPRAEIMHIISFTALPRWRYALKSRFCKCIGSFHKSNFIFYDVDFYARTFVQGCYDRDCTSLNKQPYRSSPHYFPMSIYSSVNVEQHVAPSMLGFILDKFSGLFCQTAVGYIRKRRPLLATGLSCVAPTNNPNTHLPHRKRQRITSTSWDHIYKPLICNTDGDTDNVTTPSGTEPQGDAHGGFSTNPSPCMENR